MGAKVDRKQVKHGSKKGKKHDVSGVRKSETVVDKGLAGGTAQAEQVWENPLVPNTVLLEMYRKMVEVRSLEGHVRQTSRGSATKSIRGQEACRVSVAQSLGSGDLVMDSQAGALMGYLMGAELGGVLRSIGPTPVKRGAAGKKQGRSGAGTIQLLPFLREAETRVFAGLGAALLLKSLKRSDGVVIYLESREAGGAMLRRALALAAAQELAVIFLVLPESKRGKAKSKTNVIAVAHACKLPAMTVEASDAIALYRVVQESLGRFRAGGGPVLIEGVSFPANAKDVTAGDPVEQLRRYLLKRRVCTEEWITDMERSFRKRLAAAKRS
jgi:TPP-dependent pyruvate/acetoin dehydrogenase alpha subunit